MVEFVDIFYNDDFERGFSRKRSDIGRSYLKNQFFLGEAGERGEMFARY